mgnify:CR=1 FL=1
MATVRKNGLSTEVINAVQREAGSTVVITWRRPTSLDASGGDEFTTTLVCTDYTEPNVTAQLQNNVRYIKLRQFTQNADSLVRQAIEELSSQGLSRSCSICAITPVAI